MKQCDFERGDELFSIDALIAQFNLHVVNDFVEGDVVLQEAIVQPLVQFLANA